MSRRERVLPSIKELKADMAGMTFREKVDHLWSYYGFYAVAVLGLVVLVSGLLITMVQNKQKEILVGGIFVNVSMSQKGYNYLSEDYFAYLGGEEGKQIVEISTTDFSSLEDPTSSEDNYNASTLLVNLAAANRLDYAIVDAFALKHYLGWEQGLFMDLRECFSEEQIAEFQEKDMLWYVLRTEDEQEFEQGDFSADDPRLVPVALKMDKTKFGQEMMGSKEAFFVIVALNKGPEASVAVWEYIENWNG